MKPMEITDPEVPEAAEYSGDVRGAMSKVELVLRVWRRQRDRDVVVTDRIRARWAVALAKRKRLTGEARSVGALGKKLHRRI